jgi:hypothetical protein
VKPSCQVICRCKKVLISFKTWVSHLRRRHRKLYAELKADGTLAEDQAVFRRAREIA